MTGRYDELVAAEGRDEELNRYYRQQESVYCIGHISCSSCPRNDGKCEIKLHLGK